jgi:hypothetical protein
VGCLAPVAHDERCGSAGLFGQPERTVCATASGTGMSAELGTHYGTMMGWCAHDPLTRFRWAPACSLRRPRVGGCGRWHPRALSAHGVCVHAAFCCRSYSDARSLAFTVHVSVDKQPDAGALDQLWEYHHNATLTLLDYVTRGVYGRVTRHDASSGCVPPCHHSPP